MTRSAQSEKPRSSKNKVPAYRKRRGYDQAIVTLTDARIKKRRDYWLGPHDTPESREAYHRLIAEWEANDRRLPPAVTRRATAAPSAITIAEVIRDYWRWAKAYYSPSEATTIGAAIRILRKLFGSTLAVEFGPNRLRLVRDEMVRGDPDADPPRQPWERRHVNGQIHRICAMLRLAASHELLPATICQQLKTVPALRRGRSAARESEPTRSVPLEDVKAVRPFLSRQVNALISLQLHTGARGGELFKLRPIDINMHDDAEVWTIEPSEHKTAHHGHRRIIYLGPRAQAVIEPFLVARSVDAYLFVPAEAEAERLARSHRNRKTPLSCGNRPGTNRSDLPERPAGDHYTADSYRRAIQRACDQAFPPPEHLAAR